MSEICSVTRVPYAEEWLRTFTSSMRGVWLDPVFHFFTLFGSEFFFIAIFIVGLHLTKPKLFSELALLVCGSALMNSSLKGWFMECRPLSVIHLVKETGFSFPSGHALAASAFWGLLFWRTTKVWQKSLFLLLIVLIAISRPYLGVHYLHDIAVGTILGFSLSWVFQRWGSVLQTRSPKLLLVLAIGLLMSFLNPRESFKHFGAFAGFIIGGLICSQIGLAAENFEKKTHILAFGISVFGAVVFWWGLKVLFLSFGFESPLLGLVRYFFLALWISFCSPFFAERLEQSRKLRLYN